MEFQLSELNHLSSTTKAFIQQDSKLVDIIGADSPYLSIEKALNSKVNFSSDIRKTLVETLHLQYQNVLVANEMQSAVENNINLLLENNTFTITTGQQLHVFVGPSFVLYKILAIVKLAEEMKLKHPDKNFIPIYWMASEDHDFEEIKNTKLFNQSFQWETNQIGACGRFHVKEVGNIIQNIKTSFQLNEKNIELLNFFEKVYSESENLSDATRRIINYLFGTYGVICIDGDSNKLKTEIIKLIKKDIFEHSNFENFNSTNNKLEKASYKIQLSGREINFFYMDENGRNRIVEENVNFKIQNTNKVFSRMELEIEIENYPEKFSPNAMLRPLYQETILPNISYLGGNAEINYWIQICNLFNINNISAPSLLLRPSVWIIPSKIDKWLQKQGINILNLLISQKSKDLLDFLVKDKIGIEHLIENFKTLKIDIQDTVAQANTKELNTLVEAGKNYEKLLKNIDKLIVQIEKEKQNDSFKKLEETFDNYLDINKMQERKIDSLEMLIKHDNVVFTLINNLKFQANFGYILYI